MRLALNPLQYSHTQTITLYRGDSTHIESFKTHKTNRTWKRQVLTVTQTLSKALTRERAVELAWLSFWQHLAYQEGRRVRVRPYLPYEGMMDDFRSPIDVNKLKAGSVSYELARSKFLSLLDAGEIVVNKQAVRLPVPQKYCDFSRSRFTQKKHERIPLNQLVQSLKDQAKASQPLLETTEVRWWVTMPSLPSHMNSEGQITEFAFPARLLLANVVNVHRISDKAMLEWLYQHGQARPDYGPADMFGTFRESPLLRNDFRDFLQDNGYYGFYHHGGIVTGGNAHDVFVLWDDTFVNRFKVRSFA